jgi:hypothetical protein
MPYLRRIPFAVVALAMPALAEAPRPPALCGELTSVGEIRVLRVWGTARERGFAHGYLLADDIKRLFESFLADTRFSGGPKLYNDVSLPMAAALMSPRPIHQREMEGIVEGMRAKLGAAGATIAALGRPLEYRDILAVNCLSDRLGPMCSSFAVWGPMTTDGATITARNLDWPRHDWMIGNEVLLVELPSDKPKRAGWASLTWPAFIGCLSGMNEHGVTAAMHDVFCAERPGAFGFMPRGLVLREVMEKGRGPGAVEQIASLLRGRHIAVATNIFVSEPWTGHNPPAPAAVMEYDSQQSDQQGVSVRLASGGASFEACTNHFRVRAGEGVHRCSRYGTLMNSLTTAADHDRKLTVDDVWRLAASVNVPGDADNPILTYHTIVFEPNTRRMHVATADNAHPAGRRDSTIVDLGEVLRRTDERARR